MSNRPALQFSLTALFVLITVSALVLSAVLGACRLFGISTVDLLQAGLFQWAIYLLPRWLIWAVGFAMAIRRLQSHRKMAVLATVAFAGLIASSLFASIAQMAAIHAISSSQISPTSLSWIFAAIQIIHVVIDLVCWILILMAIFTGRPVEPRPAPLESHGSDPFSREDVDPFARPEMEQPFDGLP